jgi:hypothetical protein
MIIITCGNATFDTEGWMCIYCVTTAMIGVKFVLSECQGNPLVSWARSHAEIDASTGAVCPCWVWQLSLSSSQ